MSESGVPSKHLTAEEQLAAVPPARFVAERERLAAALARAGDRPGAGAVRKLRKPTRSVWVLNQLARDAAARSTELFGASDALHGMKPRADGDATSSWRAALGRQRALFDSLVAQARQLLQEADEPTDEATMARVARGLRAAAAGGATRKEFLEGRLTEEPEEPGFMDLGASSGESSAANARAAEGEGGRAAGPGAATSAKPAGAGTPISREDARRLKKLQAALTEAERAAARAAEEASEADQAWALAQEAERAARALHAEATEEVDRARRALDAAESTTRARAVEHAARERQLVERGKARSAAGARSAHAEETRRKAAAALEQRAITPVAT
jgi:hypothetical protein